MGIQQISNLNEGRLVHQEAGAAAAVIATAAADGVVASSSVLLAPSVSPLSDSSQNSPRRAFSAAFPSSPTSSTSESTFAFVAEDAGSLDADLDAGLAYSHLHPYSQSPPLPPKSRLRSLSPPPLNITRPHPQHQAKAQTKSLPSLSSSTTTTTTSSGALDLSNNPNPKFPASAAAAGASPDTSPDTRNLGQLPFTFNATSHSHEALTQMPPAVGTGPASTKAKDSWRAKHRAKGRAKEKKFVAPASNVANAGYTAGYAAGHHHTSSSSTATTAATAATPATSNLKDSLSASLHQTQPPHLAQPSFTPPTTTHNHSHPHIAPAASNDADATQASRISSQPPQLPPFSFFDANVETTNSALAPSSTSAMPFQNSQSGFSYTTVASSDPVSRRQGKGQDFQAQSQVPSMHRTTPTGTTVPDAHFARSSKPKVNKTDVPSHPQPAVPQMQSLDDGRRSVCQSPTWEAYETRKKDKEATKPRKRRLSKNRPANASSSRPSSSAGPSSNHISPGKEENCASSRDPRSSSQAQSDSNHNASGSHRRSRSRSGSLSSLFRTPFEVRRSSIDIPSNDQGFVGGIKLEQQRLAAHQKALDESLFLQDGEVHPAFRKNERRSPSPLRFPVIRSKPKDQQKRFYPPISIRTTTKNQGLYDPEEPPAPEMGKINRWKAKVGLRGSRDESEPKRKDEVRKLSKQPPVAAAQEDGASKIAAGMTSANNALPSWEEVSKSVKQQNSQGRNSPSSFLEATQQSFENSWGLPEDQGQLPIFAPKAFPDGYVPSTRGERGFHSRTNSDSTESTVETIEGPANGYETAPSSPPPPPRRSSKRKSLISLNDLDGHVSGENRASQTTPTDIPAHKRYSMSRIENEVLAPAPVMSKAAKRLTISNPPSIPYNSLYPDTPSPSSTGKPSKRTFKEGVKATLARHSHRPTASENLKTPYATDQHSRSVSMSHIQPDNAQGGARVTTSKVSRVLGESDSTTGHSKPTYPANSSDDSGSDELQSPSTPSTPGTSRPQSERNVYTLGDSSHEGKLMNGFQPYSSNLPSPALSTHDGIPFTSSHGRNVELDPVQAAAMKVMVAFPDVQTPRPSFDRRSNSDPNLVAQTSALPKPQGQGVRSRNASKAPSARTAMGATTDGTKTPPLRDLIMSKDTSSVAAPWPASYLEAARKAAPAAPKPNKAGSSASPSIRGSAAPSVRSQHVSSTVLPSSDPIAKMFVECCGCKYYHDMPSKLYEVMANPEGVVSPDQSMGFTGAISMTVKCPWCKHEMSTKCCAGLAAMVYVKERLH